MRYKCYLEIEKRGLINREEKKRFNGIIREVFKYVAQGDCSNLTDECTTKAISGAEINVILTDDEGIHFYNRQFRKIDRPTDVLSFPVMDFDRGNVEIDCDNINPENNYVSLGDVIISIERMKAQAQEFGHSQTRELAFLTCHSILHLLGYDHIEEKDAEEMNTWTEATLNALGYTRDIED